jgi:suppressor for copper-sensitivity B
MSVRLAGLAALLLIALYPAAATQTASLAPKAEVAIQLLVGDAAEAGAGTATAWAGLDVRLGAGWHTYWRSAGDAGAPPEFDWSGSRNVADVSVEWPAPHRFSEQDIDTFGYAERVLFPLQVRLQDGSAPARLSLKAALYVCSVICTRQDVELQTDITPGSHQPDHQALIDTWRRKVPRETSATLSIGALRLEQRPKPHLVLEAKAQPPLDAPDVFIDGDIAISGGRAQMIEHSGGNALISVPVQGLEQAVPKYPLRITLVDGDRSLEAILPRVAAGASITGPRAPGVPAPSRRPAPIWTILGLALLGGLILNFMPCVFPVLSLKLVSVLDHRDAEAPPPRSAFLATAGGIVASFLALAATLSILKAAGAQIGWGLQFQQPVFLITMTIVLVGFAANLLGLFEINLPWWLAGRLGAAGSGRTIAAHMFNGFVMTLLATPCSAPFVGTAVAFALSQQAPQIFLVFGGLGLGMALPYISLAAAPRLAGLLPRPGRWMPILRSIAAAAMIATALWLLTVLAEISGSAPAVFVGVALLALADGAGSDHLRRDPQEGPGAARQATNADEQYLQSDPRRRSGTHSSRTAC